MITKEKAIDILDKIDFFQGQRAGRELWNEKSRYVQEIDLKNFQEDVALLREYIADVVPKSEVASEIFEDLQGLLIMRIGVNQAIAELKKKYTGEK